ncbi:MAG: hypothetical protein AB8G15_18205 [Saprospiraceae bacterium]
MKKRIYLLFALCLTTMLGFSQTVNGKKIADLDVEYIRIIGQDRLFSSKVNIHIDFGQKQQFLSSKNRRFKDEHGKQVKFNSMIDALNFMSKSGYEFVTAYTSDGSDECSHHYLLRKKKYSKSVEETVDEEIEIEINDN